MNNNVFKNTWKDPKMIKDLRYLWNSNLLSAGKIGHMLGISRNAVIGKAHRLNLMHKQSPILPYVEKICERENCVKLIPRAKGNTSRKYCSKSCAMTSIQRKRFEKMGLGEYIPPPPKPVPIPASESYCCKYKALPGLKICYQHAGSEWHGT